MAKGTKKRGTMLRRSLLLRLFVNPVIQARAIPRYALIYWLLVPCHITIKNVPCDLDGVELHADSFLLN